MTKPSEINMGELFDQVRGKVEKHHLPLPAKPKGSDVEFDFPDDPSALHGVQLGQMMLRFAGFFAYTQRLLSVLESELVLVDAEYRLQVNVASIEVRKDLGRLSAEVIEANVLADNEALTLLYKRRLELLSIKKLLEGRLSVYEKMGYALSRELSRREMEARLS